jgi:hypothetical protein
MVDGPVVRSLVATSPWRPGSTVRPAMGATLAAGLATGVW